MKINKVSICIPVYNSERFLEDCLKSVVSQSFKDFEVIVVNDGSEGTDYKGQCAKNIINKINNDSPVKIIYIEHEDNKGLLEARRSAVKVATGDYILNLDSDDKLPPESLSILWNKALETKADIIHGGAEVFTKDGLTTVIASEEEKEEIKKVKISKVNNIFVGQLDGRDILESFLVKNSHCGYLWGKFIKRDIYLQAFNKIPPMFCTLAEDVIQYFWISYFAKKYVGIKDYIYLYSDNTGITANKIINSLQKWEMVCSVSCVFNGIYKSLEKKEIELTNEELEKITSLCFYYVSNCLDQLNDAVISELKEEAYEILCDYWGEDVVSKVAREKQNRR